MNNDFNIEFGSLYCFPNRSKSCYRRDVFDDTETFVLSPRKMFVPLELTKYEDIHKWYKLKILLTNGEIWYTDITQEGIEFMELVTNENL